jgi:hypothetical protein
MNSEPIKLKPTVIRDAPCSREGIDEEGSDVGFHDDVMAQDREEQEIKDSLRETVLSGTRTVEQLQFLADKYKETYPAVSRWIQRSGRPRP